MAFKNRFWGVKRLNSSHYTDAERHLEQIKPYLDWRVVALDSDGILLCDSGNHNEDLKFGDLVIIEGDLMHIWLKHSHYRKEP